jgi:hypothetical protein
VFHSTFSPTENFALQLVVGSTGFFSPQQVPITAAATAITTPSIFLKFLIEKLFCYRA